MEKLEMGQVSLHCVFHGEDASENFKKLASEFYKDHVYRFVALTPDGEPKSDDVAFTAEFRCVPEWGIMVPPLCYKRDGDGCAYQCADGDDEPIDQCKQCPLCCADKHRHQQEPPNAPLTLDALREMDGEPVWIGGNFETYSKNHIGWKVVKTVDEDFAQFTDGAWLPMNHHCFGKDWFAYRRKPKEGMP